MKKFNKKLSLYEEFKLYETMWDEPSLPLKEARRRSWYGADTEVEFDDSVYPEIAKYFGLTNGETITYAFYFDDDVVVDYDDANGVSQETEDHVPIDQVEKWFKAGYTFAY